MIDLLSILVVTALSMTTLRETAAAVGVVAAGVAGAVYLISRVLRVVHLAELLVSLEDKLNDIIERLDRLEESDEQQANDHAEVKSLLAANTSQLEDVKALGELNDERLSALARDLGVKFRDAA